MKKSDFMVAVIIFCCLLFPLAAQNYQQTILALYKSSENQTESENEVFWYFSIPLKQLGFSLSYWDIDKGLPETSLLNETRAIITWFRGESMDDPEGYMDLLDQYIDAGKKVIVVDNFGAYTNRKTKQYVDTGRLNITFGRLGIIYLGDWTQDDKILKFDIKDSGMVEYQAKQNIKESSFFYRFAQVDRDLNIYLSVKRTDREYDPSPVIMTNKNGGFALTRYIYRMEEGKLKLLLNIGKFLKNALFPKTGVVKIGLLANNKEPNTAAILDYTKAVLKRAKLPCEVILQDQLPLLVPGDLRGFAAVGIILPDDSGIKGEVVKTYLQEGGGLVSLYGGSFYTLAPYLSIDAPNQREKFVFEVTGYNFGYGFILGEGLTIENRELKSIIGYGVAAKGVEVLAYDYAKQVAVGWYARQGAGQAVTWNWDGFIAGEFQGIVLESFLKVMPVGVAGTPGLGIMFVDDWPLSMYNVVKPPLTIDDTEFYTNVWWPEMRSLFEKNKMDFSSFLIFNYNGNTEPPFTASEFFVGSNLASVRMARDILAEHKEMGFHGYNHISLTLEKTEQNPHVWSTIENIYLALEEGRRYWISLFGEHTLPTSYVAPHNIISPEGIKALHDVFPSIKVISTLRSGDGDEVRFEFGRYPEIPEIYMIPRTLFGYVFSPESRQLLISGVTGPGIWSHFIHPDDVFDPSRSLGYDWPQLKADFQKLINYGVYHYPWLRYKNTRDAYRELLVYDDTGVEYGWQEDTLKINSQTGFQFRLRLNDYDEKALKLSGVKLVYAYKRMNALILQTTEPAAEITFLKKKKN